MADNGYEVGVAYLNIVPSFDGVQRDIDNWFRKLEGARLNITPSFDGTQKALDKELKAVDSKKAGVSAGDEYSSGFGGSAKKLTGLIAGAFAGVQIGDFLKGAVDQASDLNETGTKLTAVFGDGTGAVEQFAAGGAKALGQSNLAVKDAAATFGVFGKAAGLAGDENAKFSTDLVSLSTDLASFYNEDPSAVVEALGSALRGEAEPMRRFGVLMDDASLKAKAMSLGLINAAGDTSKIEAAQIKSTVAQRKYNEAVAKNGEGSSQALSAQAAMLTAQSALEKATEGTIAPLTTQQKVLAAQALVMEQTAVAQGDFEKTSGGLANQQRILGAQWADMKGKLGAAFLPSIVSVVTAVNERFMPMLSRATDALPGFVEKVGAAWKVLRGDETADTSVLGGEDTPLVRSLSFAHDVFERVGGGLREAWSLLVHGDFQGGNGVEEDAPIVGILLRVRRAAQDTIGFLRTMFTGDFDASQWGSQLFDDAPVVGWALRIRETVVNTIAFVRTAITGDFKMSQWARSSGIEEDSPIVAWALNIRKAIQNTVAFIRTAVSGDFDPSQWSKAMGGNISEDSGPVKAALTIREKVGAVVEWLKKAWKSVAGVVTGAFAAISTGDTDKLWAALGDAASTTKGFLSAIYSVAQNLPSISDLLRIFGGVIGFVAEHLDVLIAALPYLIAAWAAYKVSQMAANVAALASLPLQAAQILSNFALASANRALAVALGYTHVSMLSRIASFIAGTAATIAHTAATVASTVAGWAVSAATKAWAAAQWLVNAAMSASPIGRVIALIAALVAGIIWAWNNVDWFRDAVLWCWEKIQAAASWAWGILQGVFNALVDGVKAVGQFFSDLATWAGEAWDSITGTLSTALGNILTWFRELPGKLWDALSAAAEFIVTWGEKILTWVWDGIKAVAIDVWDWFSTLPARLWAFIQTGWQVASTWGSALLTSVWDGIKSVAVDVWDWFMTLPSRLWGAIQVAWAVAITWGQDLIGSVWLGIKNGAIALWNWFSGTGPDSLLGGIVKGLDSIASKILDWGKKIIGWIADGIKSAASAVWDAITGIFDGSSTEVGGTTPGVGASPFGAARGGVIPGQDPGRRDNLWMRGRSGESVFVPEFTEAIGGAQTVHAWNRAAEAGRLAEVMARAPGYARGGVVGDRAYAGRGTSLQTVSKLLGEDISKNIAEGIRAGKSQQDAATGSAPGARNGFFSFITDLGAKIAQAAGTAAGDAGDGSYSSNGQWGPENFKGLAANTAAAQQFIKGKWGINNIGGWRSSGSVATSDHPKGKALDVMIANYKSAAGIAQGDSVADWFLGNPNSFGTKYAIWRDRIASPGQGWKPYSHPSGNNDTLAHRDHVHLSFLAGAGTYGGQSVAAAEKAGDTEKTGGWLGGILQKVANIGVAATGGGSGAEPAPVSGGRFDPNVERWRSTVLQGLQMIGQPASLADTVLNQIRSESSGNPRAINLTDSNARKGTPSKGLIQTIDPTFQSYRLANLANDPYDPLANIVAGMRYAISRYGSLQKGMRGVAYDNGGWLMPGEMMATNQLRKPEPVFTPNQWSTISKAVDTTVMAPSGASTVVIGLDRSDPLKAAIAEMITVTVDGSLLTEGRDLLTLAGQR